VFVAAARLAADTNVCSQSMNIWQQSHIAVRTRILMEYTCVVATKNIPQAYTILVIWCAYFFNKVCFFEYALKPAKVTHTVNHSFSRCSLGGCVQVYFLGVTPDDY